MIMCDLSEQCKVGLTSEKESANTFSYEEMQ